MTLRVHVMVRYIGPSSAISTIKYGDIGRIMDVIEYDETFYEVQFKEAPYVMMLCTEKEIQRIGHDIDEAEALNNKELWEKLTGE